MDIKLIHALGKCNRLKMAASIIIDFGIEKVGGWGRGEPKRKFGFSHNLLVSYYTSRQTFSIFQLHSTLVTNPAEKLQNIIGVAIDKRLSIANLR